MEARRLDAGRSDRLQVPDNEFSEQMTGDMHSMDTAIHYVLNPHKCEFPEAAQRQQEWWKGQPFGGDM